MRHRVLVDRHHHGLYHAMQRLFEDRLGLHVFTPLGHEWWDEGYWRFGEVYGDDRLARQYLQTTGWEPFTEQAPGYRVWKGVDNHHPERPIYGIDLGAVRATPSEWAYVVATVQENQAGFRRLADELGARFVYQVGNTNQQVDWSLDPLALISSEVSIKGRGIVIRQEFDSEGVFGFREPQPSRTLRSFVNCFGEMPCSRIFEEVRGLLPEFTFGIHGISGPDGNIETVAEIADLMAGSLFGWHDKVQGDGFGHVIHDWAAIGRPLIGHAAHYRGLMPEPFWQDGVTCIDLDKHTAEEVAVLVRTISLDHDRHAEMCRAIRAVFDDQVDWAAEAERVREFLA